MLPDTEVAFEIVRGRVIFKPLGKRASSGQRTMAPLHGSLKHLKRSTDELMALTRGEDSSRMPFLVDTNVLLNVATEDPLAKRILEGEFGPKDMVKIAAKGGVIQFGKG